MDRSDLSVQVLVLDCRIGSRLVVILKYFAPRLLLCPLIAAGPPSFAARDTPLESVTTSAHCMQKRGAAGRESAASASLFARFGCDHDFGRSSEIDEYKTLVNFHSSKFCNGYPVPTPGRFHSSNFATHFPNFHRAFHRLTQRSRVAHA